MGWMLAGLCASMGCGHSAAVRASEHMEPVREPEPEPEPDAPQALGEPEQSELACEQATDAVHHAQSIDDAITALRDAEPRCAELTLPLAALLRQRNTEGDLRESERLATQALQARTGPSRGIAFESLALTWLAMNDPARAWLACQQSLEADPARASAHNSCGVIATEDGRVQEGIRLFARAYAIDTRFLPAIVNHARIALEHRDFVTALTLYERASLIAPEDSEVSEGLRAARGGPTVPAD